MTPARHHILLALASRDLHGYGIMTDVLEQSGGRFRLWPAMLYGTLRQLAADGWVREVALPPDAPRDRMHRRYYRLTVAGRAALADETARMAHLVRTARLRRVRAKD